MVQFMEKTNGQGNTNYSISCWQQHNGQPSYDKNNMNNNNNDNNKPMISNAEEAKRIRDVVAAMEAKRKHEEHVNYELKRADDRDVAIYKQKLAEEHRQSIRDRNVYASNQRRLKSIEQDKQRAMERNDYEIKRNAERDVISHRQQEKERTNEIAKSNNVRKWK